MSNIVANTVQVHIARYNTLLNEYEYLLLKRKDNDRTYPSIWQVVTGTIEKNEEMIYTAKREVFEETNINMQEIYAIPYVTSFFDTKLNAIQLAPVFGVVVDMATQVQISDEHNDFNWVNYEYAVNQLALPTHKEGTLYFRDYILLAQNKHIYLKNI